MSLLVFRTPAAPPTSGDSMESFTHLRKGTTPRRVHADLDGLKDDELGRGGFTGRTANLYRRHDRPNFARSDRYVLSTSSPPELKPSDAADAAGAPSVVLQPPRLPHLPGRRSLEAMPFHARYVDGDLLCFVHDGAGSPRDEFGPLTYRTGDWIYLPKAWLAATALLHEHLADDRATDEFRAPAARGWGGTGRSTPRQAVIPEPAPIDDDGRGTTRCGCITGPWMASRPPR